MERVGYKLSGAVLIEERRWSAAQGLWHIRSRYSRRCYIENRYSRELKEKLLKTVKAGAVIDIKKLQPGQFFIQIELDLKLIETTTCISGNDRL